MRLKRLTHLKSGKAQQLHRQFMYRLAMLQRTGRMIGYRAAALRFGYDDRLQRQFGKIFGDITRQRRHLRRNISQFRIMLCQMPIILDHRATPGCVGDDRINITSLDFLPPCQQVCPHRLMRRIAGTDMMCQRAAAIGFGAYGDIHTQPAKNPDSTGIDPGIKRPLRTAGQQNDPPCRTDAR